MLIKSLVRSLFTAFLFLGSSILSYSEVVAFDVVSHDEVHLFRVVPLEEIVPELKGVFAASGHLVKLVEIQLSVEGSPFAESEVSWHY